MAKRGHEFECLCGDEVVSGGVENEYPPVLPRVLAVQATRVGKAGALTGAQAAALVDSFLRFRVQEKTVALVAAALRAKDRFGISYWDAAILEAARAMGGRTVLSEDLAEGRDYGGVVVENPFLAPPART
jgi:predicted nucleic acid-binding protein